MHCTKSSELQNSWALGQLDPQILKDKLPQPTIHQHTATHYWHQLNASLTNCAELHSLWILTTRMQNCSRAALSASLGSGLHLHWHAQTLSESLLDRCQRNGGTGRNNQAFAQNSLCQQILYIYVYILYKYITIYYNTILYMIHVYTNMSMSINTVVVSPITLQ